MKIKEVEIDGVKGYAIGLNGIEELSEALAKAFGVEEDNGDEDDAKILHDKLIGTLIRMKAIAVNNGKSIKECIAEANADGEEPYVCYCPACTARGISTITDEEIYKLGASDVVTIIADLYSTLQERNKRHMNTILSVLEHIRCLAKGKSNVKQDKPYEDMSREELIAELNKKK